MTAFAEWSASSTAADEASEQITSTAFDVSAAATRGPAPTYESLASVTPASESSFFVKRSHAPPGAASPIVSPFHALTVAETASPFATGIAESGRAIQMVED